VPLYVITISSTEDSESTHRNLAATYSSRTGYDTEVITGDRFLQPPRVVLRDTGVKSLY
jgi:hypothetical protein